MASDTEVATMFNNNGRPLSTKKQIQFLVLLTILAWATQTLFHQWGFCQEFSAEKFVPGNSRFAAGGTLEIRSEATVVGAEVKLKQVCRWSDADTKTFEPIAELVLIRIGDKAPFRAVGVEEIKSTLHDAGVNLAAINFTGATRCTVGRSDVEFDERVALQQWIEAKQGLPATQEASVAAAATTTTSPATQSVAAASSTTKPANDTSPVHALRELLIADLCERTGVAPDAVQMHFKPTDEKVLNLAEPQFRFQLNATRVRNLGDVAWDVIVLANESQQKVNIAATARAWQQQLVVAKPIAFKQIIREEDVIERRTLIDRVGDEPVLDKSQAMGQQAARELKPGTVLTARMVEAVPLVKTGQLVTVVLQQGNVQIKTVARAMETGAFGQSVRVKNEATKDVFQVTMTGPQTARMGPPDAPKASSTTARVAAVD